MLYGNYTFTCILEDDAVLPSYKGSTFRGLFGHALKSVVCALKHQKCEECLLRESCVYSFIFETPDIDVPGRERKRIASPPHPFILEPPATLQSRYRAGESFEVILVLFGKANDFLPYIIYAVERMGSIGIGKKIDGKRACFRLRQVIADNGEVVYDEGEKKIRKGPFPYTLKPPIFDGQCGESLAELEIALETPFRVKFRNRFEPSLPFHLLIRALLRRAASLYAYHGDGEPQLDYRGIVEKAKGVEIAKAQLRWFDWKRYSNRQEETMLMGGITGTVSYRGNLGAFLPLIRFGEKVHAGKQTSFGLGKIKITAAES